MIYIFIYVMSFSILLLLGFIVFNYLYIRIHEKEDPKVVNKNNVMTIIYTLVELDS